MMWLWDQPSDNLRDLMQTASAKTGFTVDDIEELIDSELETAHLLDYLTAVLTKRMN